MPFRVSLLFVWCKGTAQKVKKNFICYCFLIFFFYTRALVLLGLRWSLWSRSRSCGCAPALGALVVVACVPVVVVALVLVFRLWVHPVLFC